MESDNALLYAVEIILIVISTLCCEVERNGVVEGEEGREVFEESRYTDVFTQYI